MKRRNWLQMFGISAVSAAAAGIGSRYGRGDLINPSFRYEGPCEDSLPRISTREDVVHVNDKGICAFMDAISMEFCYFQYQRRGKCVDEKHYYGEWVYCDGRRGTPRIHPEAKTPKWYKRS